MSRQGVLNTQHQGEMSPDLNMNKINGRNLCFKETSDSGQKLQSIKNSTGDN